MSDSTRVNRLGEETSPYLLQHARNPVDWYPWSDAALELARREDKPILLSIGYSACHWCHVMERESFEDEGIAALMNDHFVCIKVDREERPDLDEIYMTAVQAMTGHGGWPLTVFLTPDLEPFWGGTYFPPDDRMGMPGFRSVLYAVSRAYGEQREQVSGVASMLTSQLRESGKSGDAPEQLVVDAEPIHAAVRQVEASADRQWGGFSSAPKFPRPTLISLLLRHANRHGGEDSLEIATLTLDRMAYGGIYDQLGGGFHRYSTDQRWLVPHFEKMLYDNALLASVYLEALQLTGKREYRRVAAETLDWVLREMQDEDGGYYSTLDADSDGEEGRYYVWTRAEVGELLGEAAEEFCATYGITAGGNWEGTNVLNLEGPPAAVAEARGVDPDRFEARIAEGRRLLLAARDLRQRPALDDKILTDWNGLMIAAAARGYRVLGDERYLRSAEDAAGFVLGAMTESGRLLHTHRAGTSKLLAYLDGYAYTIWGLLELYETTFELEWLRQARRLADQLVELFWDDADGGFYFTGNDHEELIARRKIGHDAATPSGNGIAATVLLRLHALTGDDGYRRRAVATLRAFQDQFRRAPTGYCQMLLALNSCLCDRREIAVVGRWDERRTRDSLRTLWREHAPDDIIALLDLGAPNLSEIEAELPLLRGRRSVTPEPTFFVCQDYACKAPTQDLEEVLAALRR